MDTKLTITGIKVQYAVRVKTFIAGINRAGKLVVMCDGQQPWFHDADVDPETVIREAMDELGYTEIHEWFNDGGVTYPARYSGKDVVGKSFAAGDTIIRKKRQNLAV